MNECVATVLRTTWNYLFNAVVIDVFGQGTEELIVITTDAVGNSTAAILRISLRTYMLPRMSGE
jgi:hypothetical protein